MNHNESRIEASTQETSSVDIRSTADRILREVIDENIATKGVSFYNDSLKEGGIEYVRNLAQDLLIQKTTSTEKNEYSSIRNDVFQDVGLFSDEYIRKLIIRKGMHIENLRTSLRQTIQAEYTLEDSQKIKIERAISELSSEKLALFLKNKSLQKAFVSGIDNTIQSKDITELIASYGFVSPTDEASKRRFEEILRQAYITDILTEEDCRFLLPYLDTHNKKVQLIQSLIPTISVSFLLENGIVSKDELMSYFSLQFDEIFGQNLVSEEQKEQYISDMFHQMDTLTISSDAILVSEEIANTIFEKLSEQLAQELYNQISNNTESNNDIPDFENARQFVVYLNETLRDKTQNRCLVHGLENFKNNGVICYTNPQGQQFFQRILSLDVQEPGATPIYAQIASISYSSGRVGAPQSPENMLYADVLQDFQNVIQSGGMISVMSSEDFSRFVDSENIPQVVADPELSNPEVFQSKLRSLDPSHENTPFNVGSCFLVGEEDDLDIFQVENIDYDNQTISIRSENGALFQDIHFENFLSEIKNRLPNFKRIKNIDDGATFVQAMGIEGLLFDGNAIKLLQQDGEKKKIFGFKNGDTHIQVEVTGPNSLNILEPKTDVKEDPEEAGKYRRKTEYLLHENVSFRHLYRWVQAYKFSNVLEKDPNEKKEYEGSHLHLHGGFFGKVMNWTTPYDIYKAGKMALHTVEHIIHEGAEYRSAESMYKMSKIISRFPGMDMMANHALMDYSKEVNKTIDGKKTSIKSLKGGKMREEIVHIVQNRNSRPEHLLAALLVTLEATGELYADSHLDELSGKGYVWFDRIVRACGKDPETEFKRCQLREGEVNSESADSLNEIILLDRFFKFNHEASIYIQAMGGPGVFGNIVRKAREDNKAKGERESSEKLGAKDRAVYTISRFKSGEFSLVIGNLKGTMGKWPGQSSMGPAFVWSMSNVTKMAHPETLNDFKNFTDAQGSPFHAFTFGRNTQLASIYQGVVHDVVDELVQKGRLPAKAREQLAIIEKDRKETLHNPNIYEVIHNFWLDYGKILHPVLQLSDPTIAILAARHENPAKKTMFANYMDALDGTHEYAPSSGRPNEDIRNMHGYSFGEHFISNHEKDDATGYKFHTLKHYLDLKINVVPKHGDMNEEDYKFFWKGAVLPYIKSLKSVSEDNAEYKKLQFQRTNHELIAWLRDKLKGASASEKSTSEERKDMYNRTIMRHPYMQELKELGFDVSYENILGFEDTKRFSRFGEEQAYNDFMNPHVSEVETVQNVTRASFMQNLHAGTPANDDNVRRRA